MIIMIPIKCNGCGQELKDTRGFKSHCIKHHEGQDPGYTRIGQEVKQDEPQTDTHKHEDQKETSDSISQDEGPREDPRRDNKTKSPNDGTNNDEKDDPVSTVRIITGSDKQDRAWMDDIIKQIATPENISLAVAAGVALLSGIVAKNGGTQPQAQAGQGLTDLYGNVHEF